MKTTNTITKISSIIAVLFCTNANAGDGMGMDSTNIVPSAYMNMLLPNTNKAKASIKSGNESCAAYAGSYGISAGATLGTVVISYENEPTKSNYGQIIYINSSGCSVPPVNGKCGSDNGAIVYTAPTALCSVGTSSTLTQSGTTYNWSCAGSNGGSNATCSASIDPPKMCRYQAEHQLGYYGQFSCKFASDCPSTIPWWDSQKCGNTINPQCPGWVDLPLRSCF